MFSIQSVTKIYPSRRGNGPIVALDSVSFEIKEKEFVSIVGKSGAGKTTLLKLILAEEDPTDGTIFFDDQDISEIKKGQLSLFRRKIGTVFRTTSSFLLNRPTKTFPI